MYPQYGFDSHKGYLTATHRAALKEHGPCPLHRRSYAPVRELLAAGCNDSGGAGAGGGTDARGEEPA